jgi:hypothetical protein
MWKHPSSPQAKKFKAVPPARNIMAAVSGEHKGVVFSDCLVRGDTVAFEHYCGHFKGYGRPFIPKYLGCCTKTT